MEKGEREYLFSRMVDLLLEKEPSFVLSGLLTELSRRDNVSSEKRILEKLMNVAVDLEYQV